MTALAREMDETGSSDPITEAVLDSIGHDEEVFRRCENIAVTTREAESEFLTNESAGKSIAAVFGPYAAGKLADRVNWTRVGQYFRETADV